MGAFRLVLHNTMSTMQRAAPIVSRLYSEPKEWPSTMTMSGREV